MFGDTYPVRKAEALEIGNPEFLPRRLYLCVKSGGTCFTEGCMYLAAVSTGKRGGTIYLVDNDGRLLNPAILVRHYVFREVGHNLRV